MRLNQQIKKQRMLLNLSQEALAEKIYVSRKVSQIGKPVRIIQTFIVYY